MSLGLACDHRDEQHDTPASDCAQDQLTGSTASATRSRDGFRQIENESGQEVVRLAPSDERVPTPRGSMFGANASTVLLAWSVGHSYSPVSRARDLFPLVEVDLPQFR
jgi:hypothetical protein